MSSLQELLSNSYDDLQVKMYKCKTIHLRYRLTEEHKEFLVRQSVLSIYSAWEGFIKSTLSLYLQELNKLKLTYDKLSENYLAYQTDNLCAFKSPKTSYELVKKISHQVYIMYKSEVIFNTNIATESNANLKITNGILEKLDLDKLDKSYETDLNRLLLFRNSVAHGDDGIKIEQKDVDCFTMLVQRISADLISSILSGFDKKVYLCNKQNND